MHNFEEKSIFNNDFVTTHQIQGTEFALQNQLKLPGVFCQKAPAHSADCQFLPSGLGCQAKRLITVVASELKAQFVTRAIAIPDDSFWRVICIVKARIPLQLIISLTEVCHQRKSTVCLCVVRRKCNTIVQIDHLLNQVTQAAFPGSKKTILKKAKNHHHFAIIFLFSLPLSTSSLL